MAGINSTSWDQPLPEGLHETQIEFTTGLAVNDQCAEMSVSIAVPNNAEIPWREDCKPTDSSIGARTAQWLHGIIGQ
jgi:hypothetical protein